MKQYLVILFSVISISTFSQSSYWENVEIDGGYGLRTICVDTSIETMYVAGLLWYNNKFDSIIVVRYNGQKWDTMPGYFNGTIYDLEMYNDELYIGGNFTRVDSLIVNGIAKWDGQVWENVGDGFNEGKVNHIRIIENEIYAMGTYQTTGIDSIVVNGLSKWDGNNWKPVYNMPNFFNSAVNQVQDIALYNGELYVGGNFSNDTIKDIVKYNGSAWESVSGGILGGVSSIERMEIYNNELYVAGLFYNSAGNIGNAIQTWDGQNWNSVYGGVSSLPSGDQGQVHDMIIKDNILFVAGAFDYAGGVTASSFAKWNGTEWCGFGGDFWGAGGAIGFYNDTMYVACGNTIDGDTVDFFARWVGGDYTDTCGIMEGKQEIITNSGSIQIYPNPATSSITLSPTVQNNQNPTEAIESYTIYNQIGQKVLSGSLKRDDNNQINIDKLPSGLFYIVAPGDQAVYSGKFVKQ